MISTSFNEKFRNTRTVMIIYLLLSDHWKKYGNVVSFVSMGKWCVQLCGYDAIHEAFVKNADHFSERKDLGLSELFEGIKLG